MLLPTCSKPLTGIWHLIKVRCCLLSGSRSQAVWKTGLIPAIGNPWRRKSVQRAFSSLIAILSSSSPRQKTVLRPF
jgi:hypothetical protein